MRTTLLTAALSAALAGPASAQTIRVAPATEVAREADPRRFAEPHLAVHPARPGHLLAAAWSALTTDDPDQARRCSSFVSRDNGTTWTRHDFAFANCFDEQVAILPDGQAVFVALATLPGLTPADFDWLVVFHSSDGGLTWDPAPTTLGWRFDHPSVAVDPGPGKHSGWVYITSHLEWGDGTPHRKSAVFVARSRNGGKTFDVPVLVTPNALHNFAETPAVLSDGTLIASFVDDAWAEPYAPRRHAWVVRSADGGVTFAPPRLINEACGRPPNFQLSSLAVDRSTGPFRDRLFFACRQAGGGPLLVTSSADGGMTWGTPVPAGSTAVDAAARRVMTLAVSPNGVVGVLIVERQAQTGAGCLQTLFSASLDGGQTFLRPQTVSTSACGDSPNDQMAQRRFPTYGDYYGLIATPDGRFRAMWPEMRGAASVLLTAVIEVDGTVKAPAPKP
jgi:hypothetical protein